MVFKQQPGPRHRGITIMRALFTYSLNLSKEGSKGLMVLQIKPIPTRFPTNSLYTTMDNTPRHSKPSVCRPWSDGCCA